MPELRTRHTAKSQMGSQLSSTGTYAQGGGDIAFSVGMLIFQRMATWDIPQGATINSALLTWNLIVKTQTTTQNASLRVRAHAIGDSPILRTGTNEWSNGTRPETSAYVDWTPSWNGAATGDQYSTVNVASVLQELVNRPDWTPASYVTFITYVMNENGSDMSVRANNDFVPYPRLEVTWTDPVRDQTFTVNRCENSDFGTDIQAIGTDGNTVPYWFQGNFFGGFVDSANMGTMVRDTSFTRLPGVPTLRFTTGTPPAETNKRTGPTMGVPWRDKVPFTFSGWVYIPGYIPYLSHFAAGDPYRGASALVAARDAWVPFCSTPTWDASDEDGWTARYPAVSILNFQAGWQFWISEPCFTSLPFKHMPFNGRTPDVLDPSGSTLIDHRSTASGQQAYRLWTPRTSVLRSGTQRRVARYRKRPDGLLDLAEPVKGGVTSANMPAVPMNTYHSTKTIAEY